jgi:hypothetical protein
MRSENKKIQKTSTTQQARMDAMAARSLKKKRDLKNAISSLISNAIKCLHRTEHKKTSFHQMPVCICCDNFIIGTERVHQLAKKTLKNTNHLLVWSLMKISTTKGCTLC